MKNSDKAVFCMQAFRQVQGSIHMCIGAANVGSKGGKLVKDYNGNWATRNEILTALRGEVEAEGAGAPWQKRMILRIQKAEEYGIGNCLEQAYIAGVFLCKKGVTCTIVTVSMGKDDKHVFVVADQVPKPCDLATLGDTPICDPWMHEKAVVEPKSAFAYGSGVSTAVKHAAILKALEFGTKAKPLRLLPGIAPPVVAASAGGGGNPAGATTNNAPG